MDDLPGDFDVIVIGTGMPECIVAAASARNGKTVLHMDRNGYYGGEWASFNFDQLLNWIQENKDGSSFHLNEVPAVQEENWQQLLHDGERIVLASKYLKTVSNVNEFTFIRENSFPETSDDLNLQDEVPQNDEPDKATEAMESHPEEIPAPTECSSQVQEDSNAVRSTEHSSGDTASAKSPDGEQCSNSGDISLDEDHATDDSGHLASIPDQNAAEAEDYCSNQDSKTSGQGDANSSQACELETPSSSSSATNQVIRTRQEKREWTLSDLKAQHRKFNIDLAPKLLFSRGPLVELLISSNIARYAEFKCFTRVLTLIDGRLQQVPCSRADVFSTKNVSVVEKRMLMKLLTFCLEYQKHPEEYRGFEGVPFIEFLKSKKLTTSVEHYILHAIAMVDESTPTLQGLQATQKFLESLGRYGNSPFLWTLYGSAELPQCFCRLCAVFGGIYYLKRAAEALIINAEGACTGIISQGHRLNCRWLVMESSYCPNEYLPEEGATRLSRGIFITDSSILPAEREQLTLLKLPPKGDIKTAVTVLELGPTACVCPNNLYVVHMICQSVAKTAMDDLLPAAQLLFRPLEECSENKQQQNRPRVLWRLFFNQKDTTFQHLNVRTPPGIVILPSPGVEQDYEFIVKEAHEMFQKMYPEEDFLPRAPDPEEIVFDEGANPGEEGGDFSNKTEAQNDSLLSGEEDVNVDNFNSEVLELKSDENEIEGKDDKNCKDNLNGVEECSSKDDKTDESDDKNVESH